MVKLFIKGLNIYIYSSTQSIGQTNDIPMLGSKALKMKNIYN